MRKLILFFAFTGLVLNINAQDTVASGKHGNNLTWTLYSDSTFIISGSGDMRDQIYDSWNPYIAQIKTVVIGDSITTIGENAFAICTNLTSVSIGNSVTTIGRAAFIGCSKLTSVIIPSSVTTIEYLAFSGCGLRVLTIGESVIRIGDAAFAGCRNLDTIICKSAPPAIEQYTFDRVPKDVFVYVPCGTLYSYQISWGFSNIIEVGKTPDIPVNVSVIGADNGFNITWEGEAESYRIFRNYQLLATVSTTSYTDTNLTNGPRCCYRIVAANEDCQSEFSEEICKIFSGVGIVGQPQGSPVLQVYPNPVKNQLRIKNYELREDTEYVIYSVVGQVVMEGQLQNNIINVESLASGMYFPKIDGKVVRFIKE